MTAAFLRGFLKLENGVPGHDTFSRIFRQLDPEPFGSAFARFMGPFSQACEGGVAVDGKVLRRSFDRASGRSALQMVGAWGCEQRMVLAPVAADAKSNEITAVPVLLNGLKLKGTIVTADASDCQRAIAQHIVDGGGDCCLALKGTQGTLRHGVRRRFDDPEKRDGHDGTCRRGRPADRSTIAGPASKLSARSAAVVKSAITPRPTRPTTCPALRSRPSEVGRLHWRLDVVTDEDHDRTRLGKGLQNIAALRHVALDAVQKEGSKGFLRGKVKRPGWSDADLSSLLAHP